MVDTIRSRSALATLLADNSSGDISPQDVRDFLASAVIQSQGSGAPASTPASVGEIYVDTTNHVVYVAVDTGAATDWRRFGTDWKLAGSWTWSTNVAQVDFTGLAGYNELLVLARGLTASASGFRSLLCSVDNGSTFPTANGDYQIISSTGVESAQVGIALHGTASASARSGSILIPNSGLNGVPKLAIGNSLGQTQLFTQSTLPINALRINSITSTGNLTAGSIYVMGR